MLIQSLILYNIVVLVFGEDGTPVELVSGSSQRFYFYLTGKKAPSWNDAYNRCLQIMSKSAYLATFAIEAEILEGILLHLEQRFANATGYVEVLHNYY